MRSVKRIEIISDSIEFHKITAALKQAGIARYTVIRNVEGHGIRGTTTTDLDGMENDYVIAICTPTQLEQAIELIRPILNRFGGVCLISDALEIRSIQLEE
ncbi:MAG: P-II family nitrogen regulator [Elainella sp. Prado103]|jgi:nitrogen regulatory protein PII|nr:P-II family nitrogen regulator [Elainella sp. Prado103]